MWKLILCRAAFVSAALFIVTGCHATMSVQAGMQTPPSETHAVPLHFVSHNFEAFCYNTLTCKVVYNNHDFTRLAIDRRSPSPPSGYRKSWPHALYIGIRNFPPPAEVQWTSMDGAKHEAKVDMAGILKDQLIWHKVPKSDMMDFFDGPVAGAPNVYLEVNDRTINVYMEMLIPTKTEQIRGNKNSDFRDDLFMVWTRTY